MRAVHPERVLSPGTLPPSVRGTRLPSTGPTTIDP
jgi:hypothetical protein